jgi:hypothetical protein
MKITLEQAGIIYLLVLNVLKATQDGLDSLPKDAPLLKKIITIMQANAAYFVGNRITPIQGGQTK